VPPENGDRKFGFQVGGGVELTPNEMVSLAVGAAYAEMDEEGQTLMTLGLYGWLSNRVLGGATLVRGFDPDDTTMGLGLAIGF
jgi:opacity protein-like surface antigen